MKLSDLQTKMVINTRDGKHLGIIIDAEINNEGQILYFLVRSRHFFRFILKNEPETTVKITQIVKIGEDVILVDL